MTVESSALALNDDVGRTEQTLSVKLKYSYCDRGSGAEMFLSDIPPQELTQSTLKLCSTLPLILSFYFSASSRQVNKCSL